jgi:hypothetical protein
MQYPSIAKIITWFFFVFFDDDVVVVVVVVVVVCVENKERVRTCCCRNFEKLCLAKINNNIRKRYLMPSSCKRN